MANSIMRITMFLMITFLVSLSIVACNSNKDSEEDKSEMYDEMNGDMMKCEPGKHIELDTSAHKYMDMKCELGKHEEIHMK